MDLSWGYAWLTHNAKLAGGPEALVRGIEACARSQGRIEGAVAGMAAVGVLGVAMTAAHWWKGRKKEIAEEALMGETGEREEAKRETDESAIQEGNE